MTIVSGAIRAEHVGGEPHELKANGVCRCWDDLTIRSDQFRIEPLELSAIGVGVLDASRIKIGALRP